MHLLQRLRATHTQTLPASLARRLRKRLTLSIVYSLTYVSLGIVCLAFWQHTQPSGAASPVIQGVNTTAFPVVLFSWVLLNSLYEWLRFLIVRMFLRAGWLVRINQAMQHADSSYGALAATQPAPLPATDVAAYPLVLSPLRDPTARTQRAFALAVIVQSLVGAGAVCSGLYVIFREYGAATGTVLTLTPSVYAAGVAYFLWSAVARIWSQWRATRPALLIADQTGLTHVTGARAGTATLRPRLSWSEARTRYAAGAIAGMVGLLVISGLAVGPAALPILAGSAVALAAALVSMPNVTKQLLASLRRQDRRSSLAWADVRGFAILVNWRDPNAQHAIYAVYSRVRSFVWMISADAPAAEQAAHDTLCRVIVTQTGLPLRDLSTPTGDSMA